MKCRTVTLTTGGYKWLQLKFEAMPRPYETSHGLLALPLVLHLAWTGHRRGYTYETTAVTNEYFMYLLTLCASRFVFTACSIDIHILLSHFVLHPSSRECFTMFTLHSELVSWCVQVFVLVSGCTFFVLCVCVCVLCWFVCSIACLCVCWLICLCACKARACR
jgi:hypothetical protein